MTSILSAPDLEGAIVFSVGIIALPALVYAAVWATGAIPIGIVTAL